MSQTRPHSLFSDFDIYLFKQGKHYRLWEKLGSHLGEVDGQKGAYFAVWAPDAGAISVVGSFNEWDGQAHPLWLRSDGSGIWEGFVPGVRQGDLYKYHITTRDGRILMKGDPFAFYWECPPQTASIVWDLNGYRWGDRDWLVQRSQKVQHHEPWSVYELHPGSWKRKADGSSLGWRELAEELVPYVRDMGFTHVEFMPVMEHPYEPSWGYQITGYFAPTSRFGTPQDFMYLIDHLHQAGIGVILDWVPSHFPADAHGLAEFDGTHLYEHADPRKGFHPDWKSYIFNYGRYEVRAFLISNALFWLDVYHADGLRVDAVASMLYLDYSRKEGEWVPNCYGGKENLEAISFLREFNEVVYREFPDAMTIAEESTAWPGVSRPTWTGGLGFGQKWMMGWMHDTLNYFKNDPLFRKFHHHQITFSLVYAFSENFMLPLSHDEVVYGKGSLMDRMPGTLEDKFAQMRLLYGYMFTHPGTKLLFMGDEIAQTSEWDFRGSVPWELLQDDYHKGIQATVRVLNQLYRTRKALHELQFDPDGFEWIDYGDADHGVLTYLRRARDPQAPPLVVACHFTPVVREHYRIGLPQGGRWKEIFNSDALHFGGSGMCHESPLVAERKEWHGRQYSLSVTLPPFSACIFEAEAMPPSEELSHSDKET